MDNREMFLKALVERGLGIYGREKMAEICYASGVALLDDNSVDFLDDNHGKALESLILNYSQINLPARMTAMVLAKRFNIPIPKELGQKKRQSRFLGRLRSRLT